MRMKQQPTEQSYRFVCVAEPGLAPRCFHKKCATKVVAGEPMLCMEVPRSVAMERPHCCQLARLL